MYNEIISVSRVAIIGAGSVGSSIAYAMIMRDLRVEIIMADAAERFCQGQVKDMEDAAFSSRTTIRYGNLSEAATADIIIVTAGAKQQPGESRDALVDRNREILTDIIKGMGTINPKAIWLVVANPVDILTALAKKLTGLPHNQVLGTGTFLDTQRLRAALARQLNLHPNSVHCQVIGEHGDKQVVAWSLGTVAGGMPLLKHTALVNKSRQDLEDLNLQVAHRAYDIIELKGSTHFGIGACVAILCDAILSDTNTIYPVSVFHPKYEVYLSYPAVLGRSGVISVIRDLPLDAEESNKLETLVVSLKTIDL